MSKTPSISNKELPFDYKSHCCCCIWNGFSSIFMYCMECMSGFVKSCRISSFFRNIIIKHLITFIKSDNLWFIPISLYGYQIFFGSNLYKICERVLPLHIFSKNQFYLILKKPQFWKKHHYLLLHFVDIINSLSVITYFLKSSLISKLTLVQICGLNIIEPSQNWSLKSLYFLNRCKFYENFLLQILG
jgi:hypothetical protein